MAYNPLDKVVKSILDSRQYLTPQHIADLKSVFPKEASPKGGTTQDKIALEPQLVRMMEMLEKIQYLSTSSDDIGEMKQVLQAATSLYSLVAKSKEGITAEKKMIILEEAIVEAFSEVEDTDLKDRYLSALKTALERARD